ncbi:SMI1/KNR4 family protein [Shewanella sp.]|uniref:SMI1/KNR4 family protein n=1 Tax=Shewanella sp. TaxID=50422 RepID=UPI003566437F
MTANADNIWRVPAYLPYLQPPLTDDSIADAEKIIGYSLPGELLALLRKQNGGYIRFSLPEMVHDSIAGIGPHLPSLTNFGWDQVQEYVSFPLQGLVPFDGDGHWHLCLDYRDNREQPAVTYVDVECDSQCQIAASFSAYLGLLTLDVGDDLVVNSVDVTTLLSLLSDVLGVSFDPPDLWAHGYPTYRATLGTKRAPEWLWVTPNQVIRGFVRDDDSRYAELKELLPGIGLRFPELAASCLIVGATAGVRQKVIDALTKCNIKVQSMRDAIKGS